MPAFDESIHNFSASMNFNMGTTTVFVRTYQLTPSDAVAQAAAIDKAAQFILKYWPQIAYTDQIENLVLKGECPCPTPGR